MLKLSQEEIDVLHYRAGARHESYRVEVLDVDGIPRDIEVELLDGELNTNASYEVKRFGYVTLDSVEEIDTLRDKIKVYMRVNQFEWALGTYLIVSADDSQLELADETVRLQQVEPLERKIFYKGSLYTDILKWFLIEVLDTVFIDIESSQLTTNADIVIDNSKNLLQWFNEIASQINYTELFVDSRGYFVSKKYIEPSFQNVGYVYKADKYSVITPNLSKDIDYWKVPNVFQRIVSRGDLPPLTAIYVNDDPTNKFSTTYRKQTITDIDTIDNIATQEELDLYVSRLALKAQQLEEVIRISTANMPHHELYDIIELEEGVYEEVSNTINLNYFGTTPRELRRVIYGFEPISKNRSRQAKK